MEKINKEEILKAVVESNKVFKDDHKDDSKPITLQMSEFQISWLIESIIAQNMNYIKYVKANETTISKDLAHSLQLEIGMGDSLLSGFKYALENTKEITPEVKEG